MSKQAPPRSRNGLATGIAVGTGLALVLAVGFSLYGPHAPDPTPAPQLIPAKTTPKKAPETAPQAAPDIDPQTGKASWYDFSGEETASGKTMDGDRLTAAHPSLPFGTKLKVENVANGRQVVVRVNDRGPHAEGRIIDVSEAAAEKLGMIEDGVARVHVAPVPTDSVDDPGEPIP